MKKPQKLVVALLLTFTLMFIFSTASVFACENSTSTNKTSDCNQNYNCAGNKDNDYCNKDRNCDHSKKNNAPTTQDYTLTTNINTAVSGSVSAKDKDGDILTFTKGCGPKYGTATVNSNGSFTYTPKKNFTGCDSFTVKVTDNKGGCCTSTIIIKVTKINNPPVVTDYKVSTPVNTPVSGKITATDADNDCLTYSKTSNPSHGCVTVDCKGNYKYTPNKDYVGTDSFKVTVSDGKCGTATSTVTVTVGKTNTAPTVSAYSAATSYQTPVSGQVVGADVDGDALTYAKGSDPSNGTVIVKADGTWTYTPNSGTSGTDSFTVTVSDGKGGTATSTVTVTVGAKLNTAPTVPDYSATTSYQTSVSGQVIGSDADLDTLTYAIGSGPSNGTVAVNATDGTWTYTPNSGTSGTDSFTVTVSDGKGGTATSTVTVTVGAKPNTPPTVPDYSIDVTMGDFADVTVSGNDADGDTLTYSIGTMPAHGTLTLNEDGSYEYSPTDDTATDDSFTIIVSDGKGGQATSTISVTIQSVNV